MMQIELDEIKEAGLTRSFTEPVSNFSELAQLAESGEGSITAPIAVDIRALRVGDLIEVSGRVQTSLQTSCSRCLEAFSLTLDSAFELVFQPHRADVDEAGDEVELESADLGLIEFQGDVIDLRDAVQEQILIALPMQPLCTPECHGLCPHCGANLNQGACGCREEREEHFDSRFAALKRLKIER